MAFLNIKPIAWAFSRITLGTEMLNSIFNFYYVKVFLHLYKISEVAFYQAQMILMIWNALNDMTGYFHNNLPCTYQPVPAEEVWLLYIFSFYLEGTASIVMLLLGQQYYYFLALYLTIIMVIVQASFCSFNLPLADMVDADLLKFNWQSPLSSMVFGINALFTKPAQSLAPMKILSRLNQYGYGNPNKR
ncbi:transmembrane protein 180-like [Balaenoptera musculus]|uniref:Transmembrane protein 180-like n=1 Tax=Balaenoptera musculus TaxID=9771 RepID=A0A8B8V621_BALMU|nr:transmembrane protein 180-like [Balaenoptera musculus]